MTKSEGVVRILNNDGRIVTLHKDEIRTITYGGRIITIKPKDETTVDISTCCNRSVAVAKLLGWMKGSIFPKVMLVVPNDNGTLYQDLYFVLDQDENSLQQILSQLREVSSQVLAAVDADETPDILKEKEEALVNIDTLIRNASMYMIDINEELSKDEESEIIIDQKKSEEKSITHITLTSLDRWAMKKYGISILDNQEHNMSSDNSLVEPTKPDMIEDVNPETAPLGLMEKNILTTLAFLFDAYFELIKEQQINIFINNGKPNVSQIAEHLAGLADKASPKNKILGQTPENIRKLIARARKVKDSRIS